MGKMDAVDPTKLSLDAKFNFRCHKGIQCFTKCCSNIEIMLTPYDILRLKKRLEISSEEFLENFSYMQVDEATSHPFAMLNMGEDKERKCVFLTPEGCSVYTDRPANCRYYPIGQGTLNREDEEGRKYGEEFYFFVKEPHCLGYNEKKEWTVRSWREDQGVDLYDEVNKEWKEIQFRKNLPGKKLDEKKQFQFYLASYDADRFRRFVFESDFLNVFDIDEETVEKMRSDEVELVKFGFKYIKYVMMLEETLKVKNDADKYRKE